MTVYFSEALDPDSVGGWFAVNVPDSDLYWTQVLVQVRDTSGVVIDGSTVTFGVGVTATPDTESYPSSRRPHLWYNSPTDGATGLRDLAGNEAGSLGPVILHNATGVGSPPPSVTRVALSSDAGDDAIYGLGETIQVRLTFNEPVNVSGTPRVKLDFGAGDKRWADYASGSGTPLLEFAYTVAEGDASDAGVAVLENTLELDGGTIQSVSAAGENAMLAHAGLPHDPAHKVDGTPDSTPPTLSAAAVDGATLTLTFSESLGAAASLANDAFTVKKTPQGGTEETVGLSGSPAVEGAEVTLTLANTVLETDTYVKVSYTKPTSGTGNRLRDGAGNEVAAFNNQPVTNKTPDTTLPTLVRGEIDGGTMTLYFSEALDPDATEGLYHVTLEHPKCDGSVMYCWNNFRATGGVKISGNVVTVGLGEGNPRTTAGGNDVFWYTRPTGPTARGLRDLAGNPARRPQNYEGQRHVLLIELDNLTGVARLSVADARANEGAGAAVSFEVSLSSAAAGTVTVDYATADGTAQAGSDYTATSGTLTFAAGETAKWVRVPVLDDAVDEGEETFTLRLSNATGARIADEEATGTIANDDPLQKLWLARFGRTVAGHVTDAVSDRLAKPLGGAQVTVGGQRVDLAEAGDGAALAQTLTALARVLGAPQGPAPGNGREGTGPGIGGSPDAGRATMRDLSGRALLRGSAFHLADDGGGAGPGLAAWGRAIVGGFDGEAPADGGAVRIDGEVATGILGADAEWDRLLAGIAISVSDGEGRFDQPGTDKGRIESRMTTVSPYARLMLNERLSVWGLAGWGSGGMKIVQAANEDRREQVSRADLEMRLAAAGARGALLEADGAGGMDLALRADAFFVETEADAVSNEGGTEADASRVRLVLEGSRAFAVDGGAALTPGVELGLRHDGGDAETGTGVELGGRVAYEDPGTGLGVEARLRALVAHEDSDYREWGASGAVRLAPGEKGRGLSFSLAPAWGAASSGVDRLWSARDARGLAPGGEFEAEHRLEGELGYGLALSGGRFTGTPNAGFGLSDRAREYRLGWRLAPAARGGFELDLEAVRREPANDDGSGSGPEHAVTLRGALRW